MRPAFIEDEAVVLYQGACEEIMAEMEENSVDAIVTDPPYEIEFMSRGWDATGIAYSVLMWREALRVLKPGGHLLSFGATRTYHRMACAIEDAGFEIRDCLAWMYGSGFPKSLDVSKAIDKAAGAEREETGREPRKGRQSGILGKEVDIEVIRSLPSTPEAAQWEGWGTALKPAFEPIVLARKPLIGTVAANVLAHGTGALNIDATRIGFASEADERESKEKNRHADFDTEAGGNAVYGDFSMVERKNYDATGRWPANVLLDEEAAAILDEQTGVSQAGVAVNRNRPAEGSTYDATSYMIGDRRREDVTYGDYGGASRFFYTAKASRTDRGEGNNHPTVKPVDLMRWLIRLTVQGGGVVLDPFAGSGTTLQAALHEGRKVIGIEREEAYCELIKARLDRPIAQVLPW